ncbi:MAG TPA: BLUF domain-containing protein [Kofleriaceae bacterium]|nr:BLUF domain-containing protein [Kofleriaceae bacterium]
MLQLVYVSNAARTFTVDQLRALLAKARAKNVGLGITGMLLHQDGTFLQMLEGEPAAVDSLFETIRGDSRHKSIVMLARTEVAGRTFSDWSMGFTDVTGSAHRVLGYRHIGDLAGLAGDFRAIERVVRAFRDGRWQRRAA